MHTCPEWNDPSGRRDLHECVDEAQTMNIVLTGSIAFDYLMTFPGRFRDHILPDQLERLSLSFLVERMTRRRGGVAANIAYTLGLLGERPLVMATAGEDFAEYRGWLEDHGVDTAAILEVPGLYTASFFVNTDETQAQIASFYAGAMARAGDLSFADLKQKPDLAVISPTDPEAMQAYVRECKQEGIPYAYDPSQQIVRLDGQALRAGLEGCTALFANDYELSLILDKTEMKLEDIIAATEYVVITRGEAGASIHHQGTEIRLPVVPPEEIVDPTGVGDAFRGGFLKGFAHNLEIETCGRMGALAATWCLENDGTQAHHFDLNTFRERYAQHFDDVDALSGIG